MPSRTNLDRLRSAAEHAMEHGSRERFDSIATPESVLELLDEIDLLEAQIADARARASRRAV